MRQQIEAILLQVVTEFSTNADSIKKLQDTLAPRLTQFQQGYRQLCEKSPQPFVGCLTCQTHCWYRYDIEPWVKHTPSQREFVDAVQNANDDNELWSRVAAHALEIGKQLVHTSNAKDAYSAALCYVTQMGPRLNFSRASQAKLVKNTSVAMSKL